MRFAITALALLLATPEASHPVISVGLASAPDHVEIVGDRLFAAAWSGLAMIDLITGITMVRQPQGSLVQSLAASPDGTLLAVGTCGHAIHLRRASSLSLVRTLELRQECAETLSFSPDGAFLATGAYGCAPEGEGLQVWDVQKGAIVREIGRGLQIRRVAFAGNGEWLAGVESKGLVHVFEWPSGRELWTFEGADHAGYSGSYLFASHDGRYLGCKGSGLHVWDLETGESVPLPGARQFEGYSQPPGGRERRWTETRVTASAARFLDDGRLAYVDEPSLHLRTLPAGPDQALQLPPGKVEFFGHSGAMRRHEWLRISRDASLLVGSREDESVVWDLSARRSVDLTSPALGRPRSVRWGRPGVVTWGSIGSDVKAWDARLGQPVDLGRETRDAQDAVPSPDGSRFAVADFSSVAIIDARTRRTLARRELGPTAGMTVAFLPTGARVAFADPKEGLGIFDTRLRLERRLAALHAYERVEEIAASPDGRWVAAGISGREPSLRVWSVESAAETTLDKQQVIYGPQPPAFSADSRSLASFRQGVSVVIWTTGSWVAARTISLTSTGRSLSFAPMGHRLAVASDDETAIWDPRSGSKLVVLSAADAGRHRVIAWSPDGRRLVSSADDGALRFWSADDGRLLATLYTPQDSSDWLLLTPDGLLDGSEAALRRLVAWRTGSRVIRDDATTRSRHTPGLWKAVASRP